ncbi:MAG TPA: ABC transporter permease [Gaiellaceae bacterium]
MPRVRLLLHQTCYELRAFLRNKQSRTFTLVLPPVLLVVFVGVFGSHAVGPHHAASSTYYVPGLSALAIVAASFVNLVVSITALREAGVLERRRATPLPAWVLIGARTVTSILVSSASLAVMLTVGRVAYGIRPAASELPAVATTVVAGSAALCAVAYAVSAHIRSADSAQPIVQAVVVPLYLVSGVFAPGLDLPRWLHDVAEAFPVEHLAHALRQAYEPGGGSPFDLSDLAVLALWGAGGLALALRRFTWTPTTT